MRDDDEEEEENIASRKRIPRTRCWKRKSWRCEGKRHVDVNQQEKKEKMRGENERKRKMNGNVNDFFFEEGFDVVR